ncbi:5-methyltetrahydropteroyltriglutamate--homocysteine S-methyltransferase [Alkalihalophilus pseudofirmus]|uniref:5-methyltetrahydropteroyltriglutamate--homocysteine methyltransferase n=1 Tax=Alkalihalophilus pseudofirmus TaxID=79885 RepID=A0AAJ2NNU1_ALKPS|nr:5-methyltetrahydropteroyltriglutamate--homocysteine S-methyltransferase [Alkalihalophilus pseudofirmus]MDV2885770.1 5-methyltetrahydropteroyltriglutamate--homocysteine S-methyltransferase [Alkalihalophilus pseudofirmus]
MNIVTSNTGYPRIGENREWKHILEKYWTKKITRVAFELEMKQLRINYLKKQRSKGIELIPIGDFSYYDQVLDTAVMFGLIPERFQSMEEASLEQYFAIARGTDEHVASEMTKWFNTNYHYIVPELQGAAPKLTHNRLLDLFNEAKYELGIKGKPVILGPVTLIALSKGYANSEFKDKVAELIPHYIKAFQELAEAGAEWIQIDEPILVQDIAQPTIEVFQEVYSRFNKELPEVKILLQTYYGSVERYEEVIQLPVDGIGLDFVHDKGSNLEKLRSSGFPSDKLLACGVIDGRSIWKSNLLDKQEQAAKITSYIQPSQLIIQPSCSLLHVPVTTANEKSLPEQLVDALAFADEKLKEVVLLSEALKSPEKKDELRAYSYAISEFHKDTGRVHTDVQRKLSQLNELTATRTSFDVRKEQQKKKWQLPPLPTTTIGSFPQTKEVRAARLKFKKGSLSEADYETFIQEEIQKWVNIQEEIQLDVFVHGEFERTDMVEFFGQRLNGMEVTTNGWVQSYGSRCVKPPIIAADISFDQPMTLKETLYAKSLTTKPMKGMLTGPVTILNWSFERDDISLREMLNQLALAIQEEIRQLEANGIEMIQVDEPALREGLPLKEDDRADYLANATYAFRLATSSVEPTTQIHTHMCYSEFDEIIETIDALDADVISIEASRSHGEIIHTFERYEYQKDIGLGVYDIHSPRIPSKIEMKRNLERALRVLNPEQFWVNPDCGLKTRTTEETIDALKVMVEAAEEVRTSLQVETSK